MKQNFNGHHLFDGRTIVIATMHEKEKVIAPLLEAVLDVKCITLPDLNTDTFGTFSGEIKRENPPLKTSRLKAMSALDLVNESLVIASEGSFGPHPSSPFISANEELVILIDTKNQLEIVGRHLTLKTNFNHREIKNLSDLEDFKLSIGFPEHGLILKTTDGKHFKTIHKDFKSSEDLDAVVNKALATAQTIKAETDMRAMNNPTRMHAIEEAVFDLIKNIKSLCPECNAPGFLIQEVIRGLPCELCLLPTKSAKAYIYSCQKCFYIEERNKTGISTEQAMYCDNCNP